MNVTPRSKFWGTGLQGYITETRQTLEAVFGPPTSFASDDGKVTVCWGIEFPDGTVATIYDYKRYELGTPAMDDLIEWNVGGRSDQAMARVELKLAEYAVEQPDRMER